MGLLRGDEKLISQSMVKISVGVGLALLASSILTLLLSEVELRSMFYNFSIGIFKTDKL